MCGSAFIFSEGWDNLMLQKFTLVVQLLCDGAALCEKSKISRSRYYEPALLLGASSATFGLFLAICGI